MTGVSEARTDAGALDAPPRTLLVFIDESGDEKLSDQAHPVFAFGACACLIDLYPGLISRPWRRLKRRVLGSSDVAWHARDIGREAREMFSARLTSFFRYHSFARFGWVVTTGTSLPADVSVIRAMRWVFPQRLIDVARWLPFERVAVIFEENQRMRRAIETEFGDLRVFEGDREIPLDLYWMSKRAKEPGLEVADEVARSVGIQARLPSATEAIPEKVFSDVFHHVPRSWTSYIRVEALQKTSG